MYQSAKILTALLLIASVAGTALRAQASPSIHAKKPWSGTSSPLSIALGTESALAGTNGLSMEMDGVGHLMYRAKKPWAMEQRANPLNPTNSKLLDGLSVALGVDVYHSRVSPYLELRYSGQRWKHWSVYLGSAINTPSAQEQTSTIISPRVGVELYETWFKGRLITGLSIVYAQPDQIVGTSMRYGVRLGFRKRTWKPGLSVEVVHESNCRAVCDNSLMRWMIPSGAYKGANRGYNFLVLRVPLWQKSAQKSGKTNLFSQMPDLGSPTYVHDSLNPEH